MSCNSTESETHWKTEKVVGSLTIHTLGWIICAVCTVISCVVSFYLMYRHATNYTRPREQRQILRILLMVPIYSITTMFSYVWYWHAIYWEVARDFYEAFAIASFFALLCQYVGEDLRAQKEFFAGEMVVKPWPWPATWFNRCCGGRFMKAPRNGLTWFNIVWICVFQYCFVRVATTLLALGTQITGRYCEESLHPKFFHIWSMIFNILSVTIALYFLVAFYSALKSHLAPQRPLLKFMCIKLVIFFSFWQMILFDFLSSAEIIKATPALSKGDIAIGINALLICFEMIIFAIMHLWAFPWDVYRTSDMGPAVVDPNLRKSPWRAVWDTFNPFDMVKAFARGMKWTVVGHRRRHEEAKRVALRREQSLKREEDREGLMKNAAMPGEFSGDWTPTPGGLMVAHPTPSQGESVEMGESGIPTHGIVESTEYVGYVPTPVPEPGREQEGWAAGERRESEVAASRPRRQSEVQSPRGRRQSELALPYPEVSTMPSIRDVRRPDQYAPVSTGAGDRSPSTAGAYTSPYPEQEVYSPGGARQSERVPLTRAGDVSPGGGYHMEAYPGQSGAPYPEEDEFGLPRRRYD